MTDKAKVDIESHDYKADYKVFFVNDRYKESNTALIFPGELVKSESEMALYSECWAANKEQPLFG